MTPSSSEAKSDAESPLNADANSSSDEDDEGHGKPSSSLPDADAEADAEQKYPYQASELFSCEVSTMLDALFEPEDPESAATASSATDQPLKSVAEGEEDSHAASSPIGSPAETAASSPATTAASSAVASNSLFRLQLPRSHLFHSPWSTLADVGSPLQLPRSGCTD